MKQITVMLKPASSLCNMRCRYCFYADVSSLRSVSSFGVMTPSVLEAVLQNIFVDLSPGDTLTLAFQGGEPTLAGIDFFRNVVRLVNTYGDRAVHVEYALQTNGLLLDGEWCSFLAENRFLVGLSIDGPSVFHDANRLDEAGKGTFQRVMRARQELNRARVPHNVLMVLNRQMSRHPNQLWRFIVKNGMDYVQFIPCLAPLEGGDAVHALTPIQYATFYTQLFEQWFASYQSGAYISIKLFDDLIHLLAFGQCNACGLLGSCQPQIIVEADGGVYPCDFYVLDQFRLGNLTQTSLRTLYESSKMSDFISRPEEEKTLCPQCPYRTVCNGGCPRMRHTVFYTQNDSQCGHRIFLDHSMAKLQLLASQIRHSRRLDFN